MLIVNGRRIPVPGVEVVSWFDDPTLRMTGQSGGPRPVSWVRCVVFHTTQGIPGGKNYHPQWLLPGFGPKGTAAEANARYWALKGKGSGAHLVIDFDGQVICTADLVREQTWHATSVNAVSIGIEIVQRLDGSMFAGQMETAVKVADVLARELGIQRQFHAPYRRGRIVNRFAVGARDVVGFFGHRDQTNTRGPGDPGDFVFQYLERAGYEKFDYSQNEDLAAWKVRQTGLGVPAKDCDGVAGPATVKLLTQAGYKNGLWTLGK